MHPPFSTGQFLDVFRRYNDAVWPAQILLNACGVAAALAAWRAVVRSSWRWARLAILLVAALWFWAGFVYQKMFFATLTPAGEVFGSLFIAQAALLLLALLGNGPSFEPASRSEFIVGALILVYALVLYPAIGFAIGQRYPVLPTFGTPCPTTIFTFGVICLLPATIPRFAVAIPVIWTIIASYAAVGFGVHEDLGLIAAAVAAILVMHHHDAATRRNASQLKSTPPMPMANSSR